MNSKPAPLVVGLGEALWDCFPTSRRPGGAPANVAFHAGQLGLAGVVCTRVGRDELGDELVAFLQARGLSVEHVQRDEVHPTGRVEIQFSAGEPSYTFLDDVAWDHLEATDAWRALMSRAAAVCFGTLAQRTPASREAIGQCLAAAGDSTLRVYDVNLREPWYQAATIDDSLAAADVVKLNLDEVAVLARLLNLDAGNDARDLAAFAAQLRRRYGPLVVCVTRGANGSWLDDGTSVAQRPGVEVADPHPVGAGDAFTAGLIYSLLRRWPLETTIDMASQVAACVVREEGAMPEVAGEYRQLIERFSDS
jgi:fructokinase